MSRTIALAMMLTLTAPALGQSSADPAEQAVIDANRAIREHNDRIAAENAAAQAAYRAEVSRVEAQRRANEAGYAAATAAFEAKQARYEADMASWRAESARVAAQAGAPRRPAPDRTPIPPKRPRDDALICRQSTQTGSMMAARRICRTQAEWDRGD